jgi:hypothetical protein
MHWPLPSSGVRNLEIARDTGREDGDRNIKKRPKHVIFGSKVFVQSKPVCVGNLGTF